MFLGCSMNSATTRGRAHGRTVMVWGPQVVIFHDGLMVLRGIRGRRGVGARLTAPICSSDAIHIHITIQICTQVRKKKICFTYPQNNMAYTDQILKGVFTPTGLAVTSKSEHTF